MKRLLNHHFLRNWGSKMIKKSLEVFFRQIAQKKLYFYKRIWKRYNTSAIIRQRVFCKDVIGFFRQTGKIFWEIAARVHAVILSAAEITGNIPNNLAVVTLIDWYVWGCKKRRGGGADVENLGKKFVMAENKLAEVVVENRITNHLAEEWVRRVNGIKARAEEEVLNQRI